jgi:lipoprotein Spr
MADVMQYDATGPGAYDFEPLTGHDAPRRALGLHADSLKVADAAHSDADADELPSAQATEAALRILKEYSHWIGIPYRAGGTDRRGFDCSGFAMTFYHDVLGIQLIHSSKAQWQHNIRHEVEKPDLRCGDLVFFVTNGKKPLRAHINHVGIYLRDGQFIHSSTRGGVRIDRLDAPYYLKTWVVGGRVLQ